MKNIAIFASGNGTNCDNIIRYFKQSEQVQVAIVVCNNKNAAVNEKAKSHGVTVVTISRETLNDQCFMLKKLKDYNISLIVLAGFTLLVPKCLTEVYKGRIINIHPSLLPKYGGKGMYGRHVHEAVKTNKEKESGITIHYVDSHYDSGQIIRQYSIAVSPDDTVEDIEAKVHTLEYEHYPEIIEFILNEKNK